jgi:autonomous glycyl radical cofactor GrcA
MKRKNIVGLIALVAIVAAVIFAGCVEEETPVPTPSPTATPLPKTTPTPEVPTATHTPEPTPAQEPTPEPIALSGTGQKATSKFSLEKGLSIFRMTHDGDSNFAVWLLDDEGDKVELLVNEIGEFDGSKAVGIKKQGDYIFDIGADGRWTITIEQPRPSSAPSVPKTLKGKGQQASEVFSLDKGLARFEMTHDGDSNFAVWLLDDEGDKVELLVNEIGEFDGSKAVSISKGGIYLLDISADGNWGIAIE